MWTVRGLHKEVRKTSHFYFRAFGSLQKNITMTSFFSCGCWASWTRQMRDQFYIWIGSAGEAWLAQGIFLAGLKGAQVSLTMNYGENVVSMVGGGLSPCQCGRRSRGKLRRKVELQHYRDMFFSNNTC